MNSVFAKLAFVAALAAAVVAQDDLVVQTPTNVVVCRPILLTWSGGEPPYFLTLRPGGQPSGATPLKDFGELGSDTSLRWIPNLPVNSSAGLDLRDNSGRFAQSADFTIIAGSDTSCIGQEPSTSAGPSSSASSGSSSASGSSSTSSAAPSSSAPATTSTRPTTTSSVSRSGTSVAPGVTRSSSGSAPGASQTPDEDGAASSTYAPAVLAGLVGAAAALLV